MSQEAGPRIWAQTGPETEVAETHISLKRCFCVNSEVVLGFQLL